LTTRGIIPPHTGYRFLGGGGGALKGI
jgi:hypothetical protein